MDVECLYDGGSELRFLKALAAAFLVLFLVTALSHYALEGAISTGMAGFAAWVALMVTWWLTSP